MSKKQQPLELYCKCSRRHKVINAAEGYVIGCECGRGYKVQHDGIALGIVELGKPLDLLGTRRPARGGPAEAERHFIASMETE